MKRFYRVLLRLFEKELEDISMSLADIKATQARIDKATSDIQTLLSTNTTGGLTASELADVQTSLDAEAAKLEALAAGRSPAGQPAAAKANPFGA